MRLRWLPVLRTRLRRARGADIHVLLGKASLVPVGCAGNAIVLAKQSSTLQHSAACTMHSLPESHGLTRDSLSAGMSHMVCTSM